MKDVLRGPLTRFIDEHAERTGTDFPCAVRDVITELLHICDERLLDFAEREAAAREVYLEELAERRERIIGKFIPQAWVNGHAVDLDEGRAEFDCTDEVLAMGREKALAVQDNRDSSDDLIPERILKTHNGPFRVEVAEAIQEYFGEIERSTHE